MEQHLFDFQADLSEVNIPKELNNPFGTSIPEIARIAASEFQQFIASESQNWKHDFPTQKGKMFGVLVVRKNDGSYGYLGTISGKIPSNELCEKFVPSVFDTSTDDFFINKGMEELTQIGNKIKQTIHLSEIDSLKATRKQKSFALQQRVFEHYRFLNRMGKEKNVVEIFQASSHGNPPSAAGECAAPKLLQYAFEHQVKPIALAEFWWGSLKHSERKHKVFYPACKNKCRPILEYMLDNSTLFNQENAS